MGDFTWRRSRKRETGGPKPVHDLPSAAGSFDEGNDTGSVISCDNCGRQWKLVYSPSITRDLSFGWRPLRRRLRIGLPMDPRASCLT